MHLSYSPRSVNALFESAIEIERGAAEVYRKVARLFAHFPKIVAFWNDLSQDEVNHMETLQKIQATLDKEKLSSMADEKMMQDAIALRKLLAKDLIGPIHNLDDAYELAHKLEFSEVNSIFQFLTTYFISPQERKSFVVSEVIEHQKKLIDFTENFGNRAWRYNILIS